LSFAELFVFDQYGRNVGAVAAGATTSTSSLASTAAYGGDLSADPFTLAANGKLVQTSCSSASDWYQVTFPPAPGYAGGLPSVISRVYFVNRVDSGQATKITASNGEVDLYSPAGTLVSSALLSASTVTTLSFGAAPVVATPNPADPVQADAGARSKYVRFVKLLAAPSSCLNFRE